MRRFVLDSDSLSEIFLAHGDELIAYVARRTLNAEEAFDLVAESFAQAVASRRSFRGRSQAEAVGWLYGIAHHQYVSSVRRGMAEKRTLERLGVARPALEDEDLTRIEREAQLAELRSAIADSMGQLSAEHQQALRMRIFEERSYPEIAGALDVSEQTARSRVSRALKRMAAILPPATTTQLREGL